MKGEDITYSDFQNLNENQEDENEEQDSKVDEEEDDYGDEEKGQMLTNLKRRLSNASLGENDEHTSNGSTNSSRPTHSKRILQITGDIQNYNDHQSNQQQSSPPFSNNFRKTNILVITIIK